ncbi:unnamed protein product [Rhizophagus irregularis]|nr:unnamed protein product [Rhizophagus irregularis]
MATQQISKNIKYYRPITSKHSHLIISKPGTSTVSPYYPVNDNVKNFELFKYDSFQYDIPYNYMLKSNVQSGFNQVTFKNVMNAENKRDQKEQKAAAVNENQIINKGERKRKAADDNVERWSNEEMNQLLDYLEENYDQYQQAQVEMLKIGKKMAQKAKALKKDCVDY